MTQVVVIGAGVAGLAAAYRLLQLKPDWKVIILEQEDHPGGLAASMKCDRYKADLGPHRVFTELPEIEALLPELIGKDQMITVQRRSQLLLQGHYFEYPVNAKELLRVLGPMRAARFAASAVAGKIRGKFQRGESFEDAMIAAFGKAAYELLVRPYAAKVWKADPAQLSDEVARVRVSASNVNKLLRRAGNKSKQPPVALSSFAYIRGGVENLVLSLMQKAKDVGAAVLLQSPVDDLVPHNGTLSVHTAGAQLTPDYVISTIPITELTETLTRHAPNEAATAAARSLVYVGMILVGVVIRKPQVTPNSWIYFPEEKYIFNRAYEPSNFDPSMAEGENSMIVFEVTARRESELWKSPDAAIIDRVKRDAIAAKVFDEHDIETAFACRLPYTYPLYERGFRDKLATIYDYLSQFSRLVSTGRQGLFNHNNMDHSMLMGIRAAEYVAREGEIATPWYRDLNQFAHFRIVD